MYPPNEPSPNEPDVMPDYVDGNPKTETATAVAEPPRAARREERRRAAEQRQRDAKPVANPEPQSAAEPAPPAVPVTPESVPDYTAAPQDEPQPQAAEQASAEEEAKTPQPSAPALEDSSAHREGECIPNVPDIAPAILTPKEQVALEKPAHPEPAAPEPAIPAATPWWRWYALGTVLVVGAFGILAISQLTSTLALAASLPVWAQYTLLIPLCFCCAAVAYVCLSLLLAWRKLRAMRQVNLGALEELRLRAQTRQAGVEQFQLARNQLESYLRAYPLSADSQPRLLAAGLRADDIEALAAGRDYLSGRSQDSRTWLEGFRSQFQSRLDATANSRIKAWSLKAAGCVIASPLPLLDAILVLGISLKLIKDLCVLYNVRTGRTGTFVLLNRAIIAAFIAGVAEDATEVAGGLAAEELSGMLGESTLNSLGARVAGAVAPKLGEGAINAFFIRRLGKAVVRLLQPLR